MTTISDDGIDPALPSHHSTSEDIIDSHRSAKRFRFKSKSSKARGESDIRRSTGASSHGHRSGIHGHHHRHKRRRVPSPSRLKSPAPYDDTAMNLDPNVAFRESLFDAMGDDEGAEYWESVYGQPIHNYPDEKRNEETGKLEKMSDEEYVAFVRRGMWERSWEGIEAERELNRKEKLRREREHHNSAKKKTQSAGYGGTGTPTAEADFFASEVEQSLRRGARRKERAIWREKWTAYEKSWENLHQRARLRNGAAKEPGDDAVFLRDEIIWPVASGKRADVNPAEISNFMVKTSESLIVAGSFENELTGLLENLKLERIRWHPDKIQQRYGCLNIDEGTLRAVTEVFQVMDDLFNEKRKCR
jgi:hypothetical protein